MSEYMELYGNIMAELVVDPSARQVIDGYTPSVWWQPNAVTELNLYGGVLHYYGVMHELTIIYGAMNTNDGSPPPTFLIMV